MKTRYLTVLALIALAGAARAQSPAHLALQAGAAVPLRNDADVFNVGIHVGASLKVALIPIRFDATYDRMDTKATGGTAISLLAGTVEFPFTITPPLLPVSVYIFPGGGVYNHTQGVSKTNIGINAGAGLSLNALGVKPFVEGRGNLVFSKGNKLTYGTIGIGIRL